MSSMVGKFIKELHIYLVNRSENSTSDRGRKQMGSKTTPMATGIKFVLIYPKKKEQLSYIWGQGRSAILVRGLIMLECHFTIMDTIFLFFVSVTCSNQDCEKISLPEYDMDLQLYYLQLHFFMRSCYEPPLRSSVQDFSSLMLFMSVLLDLFSQLFLYKINFVYV